MKVIVFGGSGFLGSHVCDKLGDAGYEVSIFDRSPSLYKRDNQNMIVGDILDESLVQQVIRGADIVFNFAGISDLSDANQKPVETVKYNILGNSIILEACRQAQVKRYVFASSVYVYSSSGGVYRSTKQACELLIENYQNLFGLDYVILRYGSLYGLRSDKRNTIYRLVKQALSEKKMSYTGSSDALREYIHVEDAARASVELLKPEFCNEQIILTGHHPQPVKDLMKMIAEILGTQIEMEFEINPDNEHYALTPYSFNPRVGKKFMPPLHVDLGQGILQIIEDLNET